MKFAVGIQSVEGVQLRQGTSKVVYTCAPSPHRRMHLFFRYLYDVDGLSRHKRAFRREFAKIIVSFDLVVDPKVVPIGTALLKAARSWPRPVDLTAVKDDIAKLEASGEEARTTSSVVVHRVCMCEVVP